MPETLAFDQATFDLVIAYTVQLGLKVLGALVILVLGLWAASRIKRIAARLLGRGPMMDDMVASFLAGFVYYLVVAFIAVAVLSQFGIQTTSLAALLGAAGLAVGLALQGTLSHVASGVMLLTIRPFKIGDYVEVAGHAGTVKALTLFTTELATGDNIQIVIPNGSVWSGSVVNYSTHPTRRVDLTFGISYGDDIDQAMAAIRGEIEAEARCLADPEPLIAVGNLGDSAVDIIVRVWTAAADNSGVRYGLTKAIKERFDKDGITIPYPTRTVVKPDAVDR